MAIDPMTLFMIGSLIFNVFKGKAADKTEAKKYESREGAAPKGGTRKVQPFTGYADTILRQMGTAGQPKTVTTETTQNMPIYDEPVDMGQLGLLLTLLLSKSKFTPVETEEIPPQMPPAPGAMPAATIPSMSMPSGTPQFTMPTPGATQPSTGTPKFSLTPDMIYQLFQNAGR